MSHKKLSFEEINTVKIMNENLNTINKILTATCQKIEQECGLKNSTFILSLLLNYIDTNTWKFDRGLFAKIYQMLEIIENDNDLRAVFGTIQEVNNNENNEPTKG